MSHHLLSMSVHTIEAMSSRRMKRAVSSKRSSTRMPRGDPCQTDLGPKGAVPVRY